MHRLVELIIQEITLKSEFKDIGNYLELFAKKNGHIFMKYITNKKNQIYIYSRRNIYIWKKNKISI